MSVKPYLTAGIMARIEENTDFKAFVNESIQRHLSGDWGETCEEDAALNNADPRNAMSAYTGADGVKIWVKRDYDVLTVLFPSEW